MKALKDASNIAEWQQLCAEMDVYQKNELKRKHRPIQARLHLIRYRIKDSFWGALTYFLFHIRPIKAIKKKRNPTILLLQASPKVVLLNRKFALKAQLIEHGYDLIEWGFDLKSARRFNQFSKVPNTIPWRYWQLAAHAKWLVENHQPKLILNDRNGSWLSPFLKKNLTEVGGWLVHLAHATTTEFSSRLKMVDYHYYFIFGQSSWLALSTKKELFGHCQCVLTGSHMIDQAYDIAKPNVNIQSVLILGVGPDRIREQRFKNAWKIIQDWALKTQYSILIKNHPRVPTSAWEIPVHSSTRIRILPSSTSLPEALSEVAVVVQLQSNAVIEAALAKRAVVSVWVEDEPDILSVQAFFGDAAITSTALELAIDQCFNNFSLALETSKQFADFHLSHGLQGLEFTMNCITHLYEQDVLPSGVTSDALPKKHQ